MRGSSAAVLIRAVGKLPLNVARLLGRCAGWLLWHLPNDTRRTTETNLALALPELPDAKRRQLASASLVETVETACEIACIWQMPLPRILALIEQVDGKALVDEALAEGRGVVLIAPHLGNWEITNYFIGQHYPLVAMYAPPKLEALETLIHQARERSGGQLVPANKRGVVAVFKHLRAGGVTGILPDQEPAHKSGVFAEFFGIPALTPVLVSKLVQETGAVPVVIFAIRLPSGQFRISFRPVDNGVFSQDLVESAGAMNRAIESAVREAPAQYQWEYKRFRKRPPGQPALYAPSRKHLKRMARAARSS